MEHVKDTEKDTEKDKYVKDTVAAMDALRC